MTVSKEVYEQTLLDAFSTYICANPLKLIMLEYVPYCQHVGCSNLQAATIGHCTEIVKCLNHKHVRCICCRALCEKCGKLLTEDFEDMCNECRKLLMRCEGCLKSCCFDCFVQCERCQLEWCNTCIKLSRHACSFRGKKVNDRRTKKKNVWCYKSN